MDNSKTPVTADSLTSQISMAYALTVAGTALGALTLGLLGGRVIGKLAKGK